MSTRRSPTDLAMMSLLTELGRRVASAQDGDFAGAMDDEVPALLTAIHDLAPLVDPELAHRAVEFELRLRLARLQAQPLGAGTEDREQAILLATRLQQAGARPDAALSRLLEDLRADRDLEPGRMGLRILEAALESRDVRVLDKSIATLRHALERRGGAEPRWDVLIGLCIAFQRRSELDGDVSSARTAVHYGRSALDVAPHPVARGKCWSDLSGAHLRLHALSGETSALRDAEQAMREAVALPAEDDAAQLQRTLNFSLLLIELFEATEDPAPLSEAVEVLRDTAGPLHPDAPHWLLSRDRLARALNLRCHAENSGSDRDETTAIAREVLAVLPENHADRKRWSAMLAVGLVMKILETGDPADLAECLRSARRARALCTADDPLLEGISTVLGLAESYAGRHRLGLPLTSNEDPVPALPALDALFRAEERLWHGSPDEALGAAKAAVDSAPTSEARAAATRLLVTAHRRRYTDTEDAADLLGWLEAARALADDARKDAAARAAAYHELAVAHYVLHTVHGVEKALDDAVTAAKISVGAEPENKEYRALAVTLLAARYRRDQRGRDRRLGLLWGEPLGDHPEIQGAMAEFYLGRYEKTASQDDLNRSLNALRTAVATATDEHRRADYRGLLAQALLLRFALTAGPADLDEAITTTMVAVGEADDEALRADMLLQLSQARRIRFEHRGLLADIEQAVDEAREALSLLPPREERVTDAEIVLGEALATAAERVPAPAGHMDEAVELLSKANVVSAGPRFGARGGEAACRVLLLRYVREGADADLAEALEVAFALLRVTPPGTREYARRSVLLARCLQTRFETLRDRRDLDRAVKVLRRSRLLRTGAADPEVQNELGLIHMARFRAGLDGTKGLRKAMSSWKAVALSSSAPPALRIRAARSWAEHASSPDALRAYQLAVELLPLLAWRNATDPHGRQEVLADHSGTAREGAACALDVGRPDLAVELLEHGRAVMWSQRLQLHTSLTSLWGADPGLAAELEEVQTALAAGAPPTELIGRALSAKARDDHRQVLARRWEDLVDKARRTPRFESFLRAPDLSVLQRALRQEPVVIVNVAARRCDALVVSASEVRVVELPITAEEVHRTAQRHLEALAEFEEGPRRFTARVRLEQVLTRTNTWLWDTIVGRILDAMGHDAPVAAGGHWPRVWWCPTGPLALLPLHAAGHHQARDGRTAMDRVISSYTPTLRALTDRALTGSSEPWPAPGAGAPERPLVVTLSRTPGHDDLGHARLERDGIAAVVGPRACTFLDDEEANRAAVRRSAGAHRWVHFICHGTQDLDDPSRGGLVLHDGLLSVAELYDAEHQPGELAFLSACKTASPGQRHLDEAITLSTALRYAGWRHVIGTLWSVWDHASAAIGVDTYRRTVRDGRLEVGLLAEALHHTVRSLRDAHPSRPSMWTQFVHAGP
ncbi:CHAT domain-containing protein [Streptomyces sp. MN13]